MNFEKAKILQKSTLTVSDRRNSLEANSPKSPKVFKRDKCEKTRKEMSKFFTGFWSKAEINQMCSNGMGSPTEESKFKHSVTTCKSDPVRYGE